MVIAQSESAPALVFRAVRGVIAFGLVERAPLPMILLTLDNFQAYLFI